MARRTVLYWQDIPSMVEARDGRHAHKIQLSDRFQALIDLAAMRRGLAGTDEYLSAWHRSPATDFDGDPEQAAASLAGELEANFDILREAVVASLPRE